jgi:hypothetical protein
MALRVMLHCGDRASLTGDSGHSAIVGGAEAVVNDPKETFGATREEAFRLYRILSPKPPAVRKYLLRLWVRLPETMGAVYHTAVFRRGLDFAQNYNLLAECRLKYLGDRGGGVIVRAAGPPQSRVERRHVAVVNDRDFRAVIDQILDHTGPAPLHRTE